MKLQEAIKSRRTLKVLSQENIEVKDISDDVLEILEMGGKAPFHYINGNASEKELKSLAPWRFYVLNGESCRNLADYFIDNEIEGGKIIQMLRAAQTLIQVTWSAEEPETGGLLSQQTNIEHIAATSAAVQNMLLTATALGYENYWSSGGALREDCFKELLGIPFDEGLLASLFIFDSNTETCKTKKGGLRGRQGGIDNYCKVVNL
jgi:nitroreductase